MEMSNKTVPQGTPRHVGRVLLNETRIQEIHYDVNDYTYGVLTDLQRWSPASHGVHFLLIRGLHEEDTLKSVGHTLGLHALTVEDILHTESRNKLEEYPDYVLFIMRLPFLGTDGHVESEQLSFVIKDNLLVTFAESEKPDLSSLLDRLERGSILRGKAADDLLAAILDLVVNQFFGIYDVLATRLDELEEVIVKDPGREQMEAIHRLKKDLIHLRQVLWPLRESLSNLAKEYGRQVTGDTMHYMRDVEDHVIQLIQLGETYQEIATSLVDSYLSSLGNRTNEVMKVLTIFATIFIPLTFLAGVYGMNFRYMPELSKRWAYPAFWIICIVVIVVLLHYFKKKRWI